MYTHINQGWMTEPSLPNQVDFSSFIIHITMSDDVPVADMAKKTEIKWSSKYNDEDADVELVSSDGWHFKVHSYRLQTFS